MNSFDTIPYCPELRPNDQEFSNFEQYIQKVYMAYAH